MDENVYTNALINNNYYEIDNEEAYVYPEDCEEEFEFCKNKKAQYPQRSKSILEEDAFPEISLTAAEARKCLNRIGQVGAGLTYAFVQIDVDHRSLTNIEEITNFKYLSFINVSHNNLDLNALDVLRELEYVVVVRADHNNVDSLCLSPMPYLQVLTLNSNRVSSLSGLKQPSLECLELNDNKISYLIQVPSQNYNKNYCNKEIACPNLSTLALSRNALDTVEEFLVLSNKLRILYLSYNKIGKLNGLGDLQNLSRLHLRGNQITNLDGFTDNLKYLSYLNLRENHLSDVEELKKLACLKSLKTLVVLDNNFSKVSIRSKILKLLPWLDRVDKGTVSKSERELEKSDQKLLRYEENEDQEEEEVK
ncbi:leucine-rich repeat-containing protein 23-like [Melanaphis sacchari]|uniref:leucine-rich repeat-containing protein 23-like n=1 Tax=Melanaphis sacchari TaxID=742174 RepID=UPI000DC13E77|nr:leucine-rich repeat-containing protein 23-like [Melanaphis sacchari]